MQSSRKKASSIVKSTYTSLHNNQQFLLIQRMSQQLSLHDFQNMSDFEDNNASHDSADMWAQVNKQLNIQPARPPEQFTSVPLKTDSLQDRIQHIRQQQRGQSPSLLEDFISECKNKLQPESSTHKKLPQAVDDQYRDEEYHQYLQFKEQIQVKRLIEIRQLHEDAVKSIRTYEETLTRAVVGAVERMVGVAGETLAQQENEIRAQLKQIQHELVEIRFRGDQSTNKVSHSAVKALPNKFNGLIDQLQQLGQYLGSWPSKPHRTTNVFEAVDIPRSSVKRSNVLAQSPPPQRSSLKKVSPVSFIRRATEFSQLDNMIKELQKYKKPPQIKVDSPPRISHGPVTYKSQIIVDRGRQLPGWNDLLRKSTFYSSRSKSTSEIKSLSIRKAPNPNRVSKALVEQSSRFYNFNH